jgi:SAM-dependent methyltransferase
MATQAEEQRHERRFHGAPEMLRSPSRIELLEVERVVALCLEGIAAQIALDVGTGPGIFAEEFSTQGLEVTGIDANPAMLEAARRYVPQGWFVLAPAEAIPYPNGAFDLVFLGHILHEADDPLMALQEAWRVARQRVTVLEWPHACFRLKLAKVSALECLSDRLVEAGGGWYRNLGKSGLEGKRLAHIRRCRHVRA